jgi:gliding motility-associated lipoprotein GldH
MSCRKPRVRGLFYYRKSFIIPASFCLLFISACTTIDLFEKNVSIPGHRWSSSFRPEFSFVIKDTSIPYQLYFVFRHNEKYRYRNIYIRLHSRYPGSDSTGNIQFDLPLATDEKGWLGSGMDDIYEHRIPLTPPEQQLYFRRPGTYSFTLEQIMREDPLEYVWSAGLRIEKKL